MKSLINVEKRFSGKIRVWIFKPGDFHNLDVHDNIYIPWNNFSLFNVWTHMKYHSDNVLLKTNGILSWFMREHVFWLYRKQPYNRYSIDPGYKKQRRVFQSIVDHLLTKLFGMKADRSFTNSEIIVVCGSYLHSSLSSGLPASNRER